MGTLRERLAAVRERITRAAERARRDPAAITLLAVTKLLPAAAGTGGAVRAAAAFDGDVARSGGGHRRRGHLRAGRDGAVREAEGVTVGFYTPMPPARTGVADYAA